MDKNGKVTKLVKKFNPRPVKTRPITKGKTEEKKEVPTKEILTPDQDEISVTIDVGEDEIIDPSTNKPKIKTRSKRYEPPANDAGKEKDASKPLENQVVSKLDPALLQNEVNSTAMPKSQGKDVSSQLSPWLSDRINNQTYDIRNNKQRTKSTDTLELDRRQAEEIRLLKEKIDDLECQIKIKDREVETNKWIEKELQRRLQNNGDLLSLKTQIKELERNLCIQERMNQDVTNDNIRLTEEISLKDRKLLELQSEVNNLDKIVSSKTYLRESDENQKLYDQIDSLQRQLLEKDLSINDGQKKINSLVREIEKLDRDLSLKNMKLDDLMNEVDQYQSSFIASERNQLVLMESLKSKEHDIEMLLHNVNKIEGFEKKWEHLEDENLFLKQSLHELEEQCKEFEKRQESSLEIGSLVKEHHDTISERNRLNQENTQLSEHLRITESMFKDKTYELVALTNENAKLKSFIVDLEDENELYRKFEHDVNELESRLMDSERARNELENQMVQLKPQIQKLQVKSLEKDHLIIQLVKELKSQVGYLPADLRKEISKNDFHGNGNNDNDILETMHRNAYKQ